MNPAPACDQAKGLGLGVAIFDHGRAHRAAHTGGRGILGWSPLPRKGLAIARDVARTQGGDIDLDASPQGGLRARVRLPQ